MSVRPREDVAAGLSAAEAARLLGEHGPNRLPTPRPPTAAGRLAVQARQPMAMLLVLAAAVSGLLLGEVVDAVAIVAIVVLNAVIAVVQEGRAQHALDGLLDLEPPMALAVRDGVPRVVPAADLVPGDLVVVQAGDRVPADLELQQATALEVDESILTGESLPVAKRVGGRAVGGSVGDRDGALHTGTLVTRGGATGRVTATGADTALGRIAAHLQDPGRAPTPLQRELDGLTRWLGVAAVLVALAALGLTAVLGRGIPWDQAFLTAVALAVAAVPEGLAAVSTVALALGVGRMARSGAIIRRLPAVETLGAADVLVIDKTGTLTENRMRVASLIGGDGAAVDVGALPPGLREAVVPALVLCNDATADPPTGDPTERALLDLTPPAEVARLRADHPRLAVAPFDADRRMMGAVHAVDGRPRLLVKGAPEVVLARCTHRLGGAVLSDRDRCLVAAAADGRATGGERVLALAGRDLDAVPLEVEDEEHDLTLLAVIGLRDRPRASAAASVAAVRDAGLVLLMATGDHPATAAAIAEEVGLGGRGACTGDDLRRLGVPEDPTATAVYARVDPDQKLALIARLQERGRVVAMTGDGVNDAPALRRADIGVALGLAGSDVAREAADMVITDDDLATIVTAIREGRGIYDDLREVVDYLVTGNLAEVAAVLAALAALPGLGVPLLPLQLLWMNLLTDGLPALALAVDPVDPSLMHLPPRDPARRLLEWSHLRELAARAGVIAACGIGALLTAHHGLALDAPASRTVLFASLVLAQALYALVVSGRGWWRNGWLLAATGLAVALQVAIMTWSPGMRVFGTAPLPPAGWLLVAVAGTAAPSLVAIADRWGRRG